MLQLRAQLWARPSCSSRFASHLSSSPFHAVTTTPNKPPSILSRLSNRTHPGIPRNSGAVQENSDARVQAAPRREPRPRITSFVSGRSAHKRDHAAEKWFADVRKLDVDNVDQSDDSKPLVRKKRVGHRSWEQHEMRPNTDLNALFAPPAISSAASARLQAKRELGGDYASYLPNGCPDPYELPIDYARLVLGRNKHIFLKAQTGALNIIEGAIRARATRQDRAV